MKFYKHDTLKCQFSAPCHNNSFSAGGGLENEIYFLRDKTIEYRKSTYIQDPPMQKMKVLAQFYDALIKILLSKNSQKFGKSFGHFKGKKNIFANRFKMV